MTNGIGPFDATTILEMQGIVRHLAARTLGAVVILITESEQGNEQILLSNLPLDTAVEVLRIEIAFQESRADEARKKPKTEAPSAILGVR
jgi:hypothetical protein